MTNMIWVNGKYDPWYGGGIWEQNITRNTIVLPVDKAAHHYDLRAEHKDDTPEIKTVRDTILANLKTWTQNWKAGIFN